MDASQLVLLLSSRVHVAPKSTHTASEDAAAAGDAFAKLLRQKQLEHDLASTQKSSDAKHPRRDPLASITQSPQAEPSVSSDKTAASDRPVKGTRQLRHLGQAADVSNQQAAAANANATKSARIAKVAGSASSSNDSDLAADAKTDAAKADVANSDAAPTITVAAGSTVTMDTNAGTPGGETPGDSLDGNGQQGQSDGDQAQDQQQASDPSSGNVAATEGLGAIMAMLAAPVQQPASPTAGATAATLPAIGTSLPATPTQAGGVSTDPADLTASQVATAAAVTTTSQPTVNAGVTLAVPGPATTATQQSAASNLPAPGINLPTTAGVASALPADTPDATADFANIVASKIDKSTTGTENLRISATSAAPDKAAQLPRPLVRIDENRTPQPTVQPAVTTPPTTPVAAAPAEVTPASPPASTDYSSDGLRGFGSFSSLLPAGGALAASKQPDMIAALRQQLANASIQEQVAVHIQRAVKDSADKISIQLSPEELGRIHVKMNVDDDKQVSASITVERPATLELLQRDTKALERALQEAGLKADSGSLSFSLQRGNQGDSSDTPGWGQNGGRQIGLSGQDKSAGTVETSSTSPGNEVDTANGLVDVAV